MYISRATEPRAEANQTVRLDIDQAAGTSAIRISFTDQRLTAHGGMIVWSHFLQQKKFRHELGAVLPHEPTSPNAYAPTDIALGYLGGILAGADKLSRVAWLQSDAAIAEVLGIEAVPSQSTLSRFFGEFSFNRCERLAALHPWALRALPSSARPQEGCTLDLDSWALLHEDGHQQGVAVGYTRKALKPCHRPLIAALAEPEMIAGDALRSGNTQCVNGAAEFLRQTVRRLPAQVRVGLVRGDSGFGDASMQEAAEELGLKFIFVARLTRPVQKLCRHDDAHWSATEVPGLEVQEVEGEWPGRRLVLIRQRVAERPQSGGKTLLEVPGYRFQALVTNLPRSFDALGVWRRYNGRADIEPSGARQPKGGAFARRAAREGAGKTGSRNWVRSLASAACAAADFGRPRRCTTWRLLPTICACSYSAAWASSIAVSWARCAGGSSGAPRSGAAPVASPRCGWQCAARRREVGGDRSSKNSPPRPTAMPLHPLPHEPAKSCANHDFNCIVPA